MYSTTDSLLLGSIPLPNYINAESVVQDAADEIDSKLGHLFVTPFDLSNTSALSRPARLLIKRISNNLASGRLLLAIASPEENQQVHAYGWSLVKEASDALAMIAAGEIQLDGAAPHPGLPVDSPAVPLIHNVDSESAVEAFQDRIANPNYVFPYQSRPYRLGGR